MRRYPAYLDPAECVLGVDHGSNNPKRKSRCQNEYWVVDIFEQRGDWL